MTRFYVKGVMQLNEEHRPFERAFEAPNEARARELALSYFGSKHGLKRSWVLIESVKPAPKA